MSKISVTRLDYARAHTHTHTKKTHQQHLFAIAWLVF